MFKGKGGVNGEGAEELDKGMAMGEFTKRNDCEADMDGEVNPEKEEDEEGWGGSDATRLDVGGDEVFPDDAVLDDDDEEEVEEDEDEDEEVEEERCAPFFRECVGGGFVAVGCMRVGD